MDKFFVVCIGAVLTLTTAVAFAAKDSGDIPSALTCADFVPTQEAIERYPDLIGACESVVERDGELYGLFRAIVRRVVGNSVILYLPVTDHTFKTSPNSQSRVLAGGVKARPRDLRRGEEIRIYLAAKSFSKPIIEEVTFMTDSELIIEHEVEAVAALSVTG